MIYKEIIGIACFAIMFSETSGIDWQIKPFSCYKCMAWWTAISYFLCKLSTPLIDVILYSAITHITSIVIYYLLKQIKGNYL